jgi:hypothetical protein
MHTCCKEPIVKCSFTSRSAAITPLECVGRALLPSGPIHRGEAPWIRIGAMI